MKIYIAGPMTGIPKYNRPAFHFEAMRLASEGHVALNPATLPDSLSQPEYMDICLAMLRCADGIFLLSGWQNSAGAKAEHALAQKLELEIFYQDGIGMVNATKDLVAAGHALAKDLRCAKSAALVRELATQLDIQRARADALANRRKLNGEIA